MKNQKRVLGYYKFLMMAILREGPLTLRALWRKSILFLSMIWYQQLPEPSQPVTERWFLKFSQLRAKLQGRAENATGTPQEAMDTLMARGWVRMDGDSYALTPVGVVQAERYDRRLKGRVGSVEKSVLSPLAAAKNTTYLDFLLAAVKLSAGLVSGSVGLIADGTDAIMDTVSALFVWLGIKYHRENLSTLLVIAGLFIASITVGYGSGSHIMQALDGTLEPLTLPYLVIAVEGFGVLIAFFLFYYQRYVGKIARNLTLVSQSVDSKNHIFISAAVILGAVFAIHGIYYVDAIIGLFIAVAIFWDAVGLVREAFSAGAGEESEFGNYRLPLQECWEKSRLLAFHNWILYVVGDEHLKTRPEIIASLHQAFHPDNYIPVLSELGTTAANDYDFEGNFEGLVKSLEEHDLLRKDREGYHLTATGVKYLKDFWNSFEYYDVHGPDTVLLAMARDA